MPITQMVMNNEIKNTKQIIFNHDNQRRQRSINMTNLHLIDFIQSFNLHEIKVVGGFLEKMALPKELQLFKIIVSTEQKISDKDLIAVLRIDEKPLRVLKNSLHD